MAKTTVDTDKVTRVEVIGDDGRELVRHIKSLTISIQDDEKTLKLFMSQTPKRKLMPHEQDEIPSVTD